MQQDRSSGSMVTIERRSHRLIRGMMRRAPVHILSLTGLVLEHLFRRGEFVGYLTGSDEIVGGVVQALELWERVWQASFKHSDLTLLATMFYVNVDQVFQRKKGFFVEWKLLGREINCKARK